MRIYSKVEKDTLLHIINKKENINSERCDLTPENEFLQVSSMKLNKKKFRAHKHIENIRVSNITQEAWVVIKGTIKVILYDLDDTIIHEDILNEGDCSMTFRGGHNYECLEDESLAYEFKLGPYKGVHNDKVLLPEDASVESFRS